MEILHSYRKMALIQRLSGTFKHRSYNLLEHSFMVQSYFKHFAKQEGIDYNLAVLDLVANHDIIETETGDLIQPVKALSEKTAHCWDSIEECVAEAFPHLQRYSDKNIEAGMNKQQFRLFKEVDLLDLYVFCLEELKIGNQTDAICKIIHHCDVRFTREDYPFLSIQEYIKSLG